MADGNKSKPGKLNELSADIGLRTSAQPVQTGYDALLEDIFGLNMRSLRTLKTLFKAPADYFKAARLLIGSFSVTRPHPGFGWVLLP